MTETPALAEWANTGHPSKGNRATITVARIPGVMTVFHVAADGRPSCSHRLHWALDDQRDANGTVVAPGAMACATAWAHLLHTEAEVMRRIHAASLRRADLAELQEVTA